jgi:hypothetical protein
MTDTKRILSWEDDGNESYAGTDIGEYQIYFDFEFGWGATFDNDCILDFPNGENSLDVAKSVCEADYVARCTEFLRVAGPGEVVVPIKVAIDAHDTAISSRHFWVKFADMLARFDNAINGLSAAIDAASKE